MNKNYGSWSEYKAAIEKDSDNKDTLEYETIDDNRYAIRFFDGAVFHDYILWHSETSDKSDFDDHYKSLCNLYLQKRQTMQTGTDYKTGGNYQAYGAQVDVGSTQDQVYTETLSFPFPIKVLAAEWQNHSDYDGDEMTVVIGEDTIIGTITSAIAVDDTEIEVSDTVVENIKLGFWFKVGTEDFGRIIAIDKENKTVTVENAATSTHSSGTYAKMTIKIVYNYYFKEGTKTEIGIERPDGSLIPANTVMKIYYTQRGTTAKTFKILLKIQY